MKFISSVPISKVRIDVPFSPNGTIYLYPRVWLEAVMNFRAFAHIECQDVRWSKRLDHSVTLVLMITQLQGTQKKFIQLAPTHMTTSKLLHWISLLNGTYKLLLSFDSDARILASCGWVVRSIYTLTEPICLNFAVASTSVSLPRPCDAVGVDPSPAEVGSSLGSVSSVGVWITERKQQRCFLPRSCTSSTKFIEWQKVVIN